MYEADRFSQSYTRKEYHSVKVKEFNTEIAWVRFGAIKCGYYKIRELILLDPLLRDLNEEFVKWP